MTRPALRKTKGKRNPASLRLRRDKKGKRRKEKRKQKNIIYERFIRLLFPLVHSSSTLLLYFYVPCSQIPIWEHNWIRNFISINTKYNFFIIAFPNVPKAFGRNEQKLIFFFLHHWIFRVGYL